MDIGSQNQHFRWLTIWATFFCAGHLYAVTDLSEKSYGPSKGWIPVSYYDKIRVNLDNKTLVKEWAELAIGHFLDDECPLPRCLSATGEFRDHTSQSANHPDAPSLYKSREGGDALMWALLQIYKRYPDDADAQSYYQRVIAFADEMLAHGTDRYGSVHSPILASILTREDSIPRVPDYPLYSGNPIDVKRKYAVYSFSDDKIVHDDTAIGIGNIWHGGDQAHKDSYGGVDIMFDEKLYETLWELSELTGDLKYKKAADASIMYWLEYAPAEETNLFPWGEHTGYNFYYDDYDRHYYSCRYVEYESSGTFLFGISLYDKFIEHQPRVRKGEYTVMEKCALAHIPTGTAYIQNNDNGLKGMFIYTQHQTLWGDISDLLDAGDPDPRLPNLPMKPRAPGMWLHHQAFTYNRSNNTVFKEAILTGMNIIADGLEQQRDMLDIDYY